MTRRTSPKVAVIPPRAQTIRETPEGLEKICLGCNSWWPATTECFTSHEGRPDGLAYRCKACISEANLAAYVRRVGRRPIVPPQLQPLASVPWLATHLPTEQRGAP